jgi:uncharacterized damage-inducible protein DinB
MTIQIDTPDEILALYIEGADLLEEAISGLNDSDLDQSLLEDSWSIRQIVHHVADGDDLWKNFIKAALGDCDGALTLQWYWDKPQMEWAECWKYAQRNVEPSLALLHLNRQIIGEILQEIPDAWDKSVRIQHPQRGEERVTVEQIMKMQARHVVGHIQDIQAIRKTHQV